jgi:hypothetical protein
MASEMPRLREVPNCRQVPGERPRRWFESEAMDLIVWLSADGRPVGFQICYDKGRRERALTSTVEGRLTVASVDDGEGGASGYKEAPVLVSETPAFAPGPFEVAHVRRLFDEASGDVPAEIVELVRATLG